MATIQQLKLIARIELGLSDAFVRQFGKLTAKKTWESAIAAFLQDRKTFDYIDRILSQSVADVYGAAAPNLVPQDSPGLLLHNWELVMTASGEISSSGNISIDEDLPLSDKHELPHSSEENITPGGTDGKDLIISHKEETPTGQSPGHSSQMTEVCYRLEAIVAAFGSMVTISSQEARKARFLRIYKQVAALVCFVQDCQIESSGLDALRLRMIPMLCREDIPSDDAEDFRSEFFNWLTLAAASKESPDSKPTQMPEPEVVPGLGKTWEGCGDRNIRVTGRLNAGGRYFFESNCKKDIALRLQGFSLEDESFYVIELEGVKCPIVMSPSLYDKYKCCLRAASCFRAPHEFFRAWKKENRPTLRVTCEAFRWKPTCKVFLNALVVEDVQSSDEIEMFKESPIKPAPAPLPEPAPEEGDGNKYIPPTRLLDLLLLGAYCSSLQRELLEEALAPYRQEALKEISLSFFDKSPEIEMATEFLYAFPSEIRTLDRLCYSTLLCLQDFSHHCYQVYAALGLPTFLSTELAEGLNARLLPRHKLPFWLSPKDKAIAAEMLTSARWEAFYAGKAADLYCDEWELDAGLGESTVPLGHGWKYVSFGDGLSLDVVVNGAVFSIDSQSIDYQYQKAIVWLKEIISTAAHKWEHDNACGQQLHLFEVA